MTQHDACTAVQILRKRRGVQLQQSGARKKHHYYTLEVNKHDFANIYRESCSACAVYATTTAAAANMSPVVEVCTLRTAFCSVLFLDRVRSAAGRRLLSQQQLIKCIYRLPCFRLDWVRYNSTNQMPPFLLSPNPPEALRMKRKDAKNEAAARSPLEHYSVQTQTSSPLQLLVHKNKSFLAAPAKPRKPATTERSRTRRPQGVSTTHRAAPALPGATPSVILSPEDGHEVLRSFPAGAAGAAIGIICFRVARGFSLPPARQEQRIYRFRFCFNQARIILYDACEWRHGARRRQYHPMVSVRDVARRDRFCLGDEG